MSPEAAAAISVYRTAAIRLFEEAAAAQRSGRVLTARKLAWQGKLALRAAMDEEEDAEPAGLGELK